MHYTIHVPGGEHARLDCLEDLFETVDLLLGLEPVVLSDLSIWVHFCF